MRKKILYLPMTTLPEDDAHFKGGYRMESVRVERLDHLGLIASVIKDLGLVDVLPALKDGASTAVFPSPVEGSGITQV
jgi:hypothetical protein